MIATIVYNIGDFKLNMFGDFGVCMFTLMLVMAFARHGMCEIVGSGLRFLHGHRADEVHGSLPSWCSFLLRGPGVARIGIAFMVLFLLRGP